MSKLIIAFWVIGVLFIFLVGIVAGMLLGTYALIDHTLNSRILDGTQITVNFNETKLMEEFNRTVLPQMEKWKK
jgi:hypothetical protein